MGQAKDRGTRQERAALARERDALEREVDSLIEGKEYVRQMVEVKRRFRAAEHILAADTPISGDIDIDNECVFAQIRRIIELITFSALIADRGHYQAHRLREAQDNPRDKGDYTLDWNANEILKRLKKVNPNFLPQSAGDPQILPDKTKHIPYGSVGRKSHGDLIRIYQTASRYLHAPNPFATDQQQLEALKLAKARSVLNSDLKLLKGIIWKHNKFGLMPRHPKVVGKKFVWIVDLLDAASDKVEIHTALQDT